MNEILFFCQYPEYVIAEILQEVESITLNNKSGIWVEGCTLNMKFYPSARRILQQKPWFQWIMIGVLEQTYPPNLFHCMAEVQSKVLTRTSAGRWEAFISLWADRQTLIWQVSLLHCECEMLDYNAHTPSFQTKTYSRFLSFIYEYQKM